MATSVIKTNASAWASVNNYIAYKKAGGNVTVMGSSSGSGTLQSGVWNDLGTLPVGFRPSREILFTFILRGTIQPSMGRIGTDGVVSLYNESSSAQGYWVYNVTFPI